MDYYLGIDLGGTSIKCGIVDTEYRIIGRSSSPTPLGVPVEELCGVIASAAVEAVKAAGLSMDDIRWVGMGFPGTIDKINKIVMFSNNLSLRNAPVGTGVETLLQKPLYMDNDANCAAYGETLAGGGKGFHDVIAVTLGTGVGGGIVIGGRICAGFNNAGGELGHSGMVYDGVPCNCGRRGCVESYCSATALIRQTKEVMKKDSSSRMWEICGGDLSSVNGKTAFDAMRLGDPAGTAVVDEYIGYLGYAVTSFLNIFQPEVLLLGGGIAREGETLLGPIRRYVQENCYIKEPENLPRIAQATLGNDAGIIGAAFLGRMS